ncbi:esterase/lipase family protein [Yinghuangia soli]|uniref:Alpha/beta fold hydrolase n=1 Tax=Yinghuangia soli TaxID=2908204 RepID=A0AA41Q2D9_9ACTN|nr:alpha/beta fold hydrolase [Yinghuangia soli]MCF2530051.1 alpha/beta fold hydrolase [Yinghuangia soli]
MGALPSVDVLRGTVREVVWTVGHLALYPTGLLQLGLDNLRAGPADGADPADAPELPPPPGSAALPVVLVHGLADNRSIFAVLGRALRRDGMSSVHLFDHHPLGGDIRSKAELLDRHIAQVCARTGAPGVHVVGHSLGGLVARYHAQFVDRGARVRTVVTLGTPHRGTAAAQLLRAHPLVRELCPDSPVIAELAGPAPGCTTRFVAYWGDLDPFVVPCSSGALVHPDLDAASVLVRGAGHLTLPACRTVVADVCALFRSSAEMLRTAASAPGRPTALAA